jgi:hypothetical protein
MMKLLGCLLLAGVLAFSTAIASDDRWIHIRVDDADGAKGRVDIQVPITLVSSLLPVLKQAHGHGSIHVDADPVDLEQIRGYWSAVRSAKDGEYVTVRDADSDVRVSKRGGYFLVNVDDKGGRSRVRMKLPLPLVDAVLDGKDSINLNTLSDALAKAPAGELLTVDGEDGHVRIWIDAAAAPPREDTP